MLAAEASGEIPPLENTPEVRAPASKSRSRAASA
jgi:hypothetical protein